MRKLRLGILGSGKGSNFKAILEAIDRGELDAEVGIVISDQPGAGILDHAANAGVPFAQIEEQRYKTKLSPEIEDKLIGMLRGAKVDLIVLAGYMRMVKERMLSAFEGRIINIHPSLLPKFPGIESWRQALEAGEIEAGCTVHFVDAGMDTGEIIAQVAVPILPGDTAASLHERIQVEERRLYPQVISTFCAGGSRSLIA